MLCKLYNREGLLVMSDARFANPMEAFPHFYEGGGDASILLDPKARKLTFSQGGVDFTYYAVEFKVDRTLEEFSMQFTIRDKLNSIVSVASRFAANDIARIDIEEKRPVLVTDELIYANGYSY